MGTKERELGIPPEAGADPKSWEIVRAWVAHGGLHCSISAGAWENNEAVGWGILLSDIARHAADALAKLKGQDRRAFLSEVQRVFNDELDAPSAETSGGFVQ
jgi:hypothetical protein